MAMNNRGLGRGLDALFDSGSPADMSASASSPLVNAPLDSITPSQDQPREVFPADAMEELAASIKQYGILEPLLVRPGTSPGTYRLIAGERRWRAARIAGLAEVPVIVRDIDDREALIITLLENLQREDLNPIEEAKGIEALRSALMLTLDAVAETLGKSRSAISHSLRLLRLPAAIQDEVAEGRISVSHAKTLGGISDEEALLTLGQRIIETSMTARDTEEAVAFWNQEHFFPWEDRPEAEVEGEKQEKIRPARDPGIGRLAVSIGNILNCRAKISGTQDKGKISLAYDSNEQLFALLDKLGMSIEDQVE